METIMIDILEKARKILVRVMLSALVSAILTLAGMQFYFQVTGFNVPMDFAIVKFALTTIAAYILAPAKIKWK